MIIHGYEFMEVLGIWKQVLYISLVLFGEIVFFIYGYFSTKQTYYKKKIPTKLNSDDDSLEAGIDCEFWVIHFKLIKYLINIYNKKCQEVF